MGFLQSFAVSGWAAEIAFTVIVKGGLLLGSAWVLASLAKGRSAATRYALWALAVGGLLALPALPFVFPGSNLGLVESPALLLSGADLDAAGVGTTGSVEHSGSSSGAGDSATSTGAGWRWAAPLLLLVWASGSVFLLGRLLVDWARVVWITSVGARGGIRRSLTRRAIVLARRQGVQRRIRVVVSAHMRVPVTWGLVRPVVILPSQAEEWDPARLDAVLLHELAHVRRWDYLTHMIGEAARALYWPNPLVWLALRRARMERERACDDAVLRFGTAAAEYATLLLDLARTLAGGRSVLRGAMAIARPSMLETRINGVLDLRSDRRPTAFWRVAFAALMMAAVMAPIGNVRVWASPPRTEAQWIEALTRRDPTVRVAAIEVLETLGSSDAVEALAVLVDDGDPAVRLAALNALGRVGDERAIPALVGIVTGSHGDLYRKRLAAGALARIDDRAALAALADQLDSRGADGRARSSPLRRGEPDPSIWTPLVRILLEDPDPAARGLAAAALVELGCESAIPELLTATRDPVPEVRMAAVNALAGFKTWPVRDALDRLAERDPDARVRMAASDALECDDH